MQCCGKISAGTIYFSLLIPKLTITLSSFYCITNCIANIVYCIANAIAPDPSRCHQAHGCSSSFPLFPVPLSPVLLFPGVSCIIPLFPVYSVPAPGVTVRFPPAISLSVPESSMIHHYPSHHHYQHHCPMISSSAASFLFCLLYLLCIIHSLIALFTSVHQAVVYRETVQAKCRKNCLPFFI